LIFGSGHGRAICPNEAGLQFRLGVGEGSVLTKGAEPEVSRLRGSGRETDDSGNGSGMARAAITLPVVAEMAMTPRGEAVARERAAVSG